MENYRICMDTPHYIIDIQQEKAIIKQCIGILLMTFTKVSSKKRTKYKDQIIIIRSSYDIGTQ